MNKVLLSGNLGSDPDLRYTPSGTAVATFRLATSERIKDSKGEYQDYSEWHNLVVWGKQAEACDKLLNKGDKLFIEGKIQTRSYDKDGQKRYITEIKVSEFDLLRKKEKSQDEPKQKTLDDLEID